MNVIVLVVAFLLTPAAAHAQSNGSTHPVPPPEVRAVALSSPLAIDGRLDEPAWAAAPAATDFIQSQPDEGDPATQRTEVRFLFDDAAIYVGARMYDSLGAEGVRARLVRRDGDPESDNLTIVFDTFHDHLGRTRFEINPSGVKGDAYGPGNSFEDSSWDPVWQAATAIDSLGWTAELRIPLAQLRFPADSLQSWGLQLVRMANRLNERSHWAFWRQTETGGPSRYGHLEGIRITKRPSGAEILPYIVARSSHIQPSNPDDPFQSPHEINGRIGADLKYLLTSNLTLAATINPDFGQVEVDPAVVNLSAFETFFPEKRPFFIEGQGFFSFGGTSCYSCSNLHGLSYFYSRRIGRAPQGAGLAHAAGEFASVPENTTILGAAKITGRTRGGYSIAFLDAVTRREHAPVIGTGGGRSRVEVEPLTNYLVGRVKRDLRGGDLVVGGVFSSVLRNLENPALGQSLNRHAESVGVDADLWLGDRTYRLVARALFTQIAGDSSAILRAQRSSARYFQRPDRQAGSNGLFSRAYDPSATSLRGYGAWARLSKESGDWLWEAATNIRSPGFENNDIAFLSKADYVWVNGNVVRRWTEPTRYYRSIWLSAGGQQETNFDGDLTDRRVRTFLGWTFPNYWHVGTFHQYVFSALDDRMTRGGPVVRKPGFYHTFFNLSTDSRKSLVLSTGPSYGRSSEGDYDYSLNLDATYKPASNVSLSVGPSFSRSTSSSQYVTASDDPTATAFYGRRYVFADLVQKTVSMNTRLNVTFTPTLSLELFAQPFISSARFSNFKEFDAPGRLEKSVYGTDIGTIASAGEGFNETYTIDPDGAGPAQAFTVNNPDFNLRSLRGNAVLRWEYRPGSTLFLVWTQSRQDMAPFGDLSFGRDRDALFDAQPDNIFLIKVNYWLGL